MKYKIGDHEREYELYYAFDVVTFREKNESNLFEIFTNNTSCPDTALKIIESKCDEVEDYLKDIMTELYRRFLDDNN